MRVYDVNLTSSSAAGSGRTQGTQGADRAGSGKAGESVAAGNGDRVEFSGSLGRLSQTLATSASQRASRVQALAEQYRAGSFRPDSAATSRGMVAEALAAGK